VKLTNKISFVLGFRTFLLVLLLGFVMSFLQTYFDFKNRYTEVSRSIESTVESSRASAARAVYLVDPNLAEQIIKGLTHFDYFSYVAIIDERGKTMAESIRDDVDYVNPVLSIVAPNYADSEVVVGQGNFSGKMILRVNNHVALIGVYDRATRTFIISLLGYMTLSLALVLLYHNSLAVPLMRLAKRLQRVNTTSITEQSIGHLRGHEENEFSLIVDSANDLLSRIATGQLLLTQRSQRFRLILDTAPLLIYSIDSEGKFVFANKSTASFYGYSIFDLKGKTAEEVIGEVDPKLLALIKDFMHNDSRQYKTTLEMFNYESQSSVNELSLVKFHTFDGQSLLIVSNDITKRVEAEEKIENLAYYDPLTTLPNRNKVYEVLNRVTKARSVSIYDVAILADLDQFKRINDTLSHSVGDQLIVELTKRLKNDFAKTGLIARLGADEFLYHRENVSSEYEIAKVIALELAEQIRMCINQEIELGIHRYSLSGSLGVVIYEQGKDTADQILQYADTAMYESKKLGRNCVTLFKSEMAMHAAQMLQLERDIAVAMLEDQFYFVLQPIVHSISGKLVSAEALIRWNKNEQIIPPDEFIPFLEESALIVEVGDTMLNKVCEYIAGLKAENKIEDDFKIAVNISGKQFSDSKFIQRIIFILRKHQVSGQHLEFEITESVALVNLKETIEKINELKKMGISFSLDDFGTGYSSLSHLKDLPVDKLKIDRSFINDISVDKQDENLVLSIIQLSKNLGLTIVAEGVETQQQLDWLTATGELLLQGYYFSRPIVPPDFNEKYFSQNTDPQIR